MERVDAIGHYCWKEICLVPGVQSVAVQHVLCAIELTCQLHVSCVPCFLLGRYVHTDTCALTYLGTWVGRRAPSPTWENKEPLPLITCIRRAYGLAGMIEVRCDLTTTREAASWAIEHVRQLDVKRYIIVAALALRIPRPTRCRGELDYLSTHTGAEEMCLGSGRAPRAPSPCQYGNTPSNRRTAYACTADPPTQQHDNRKQALKADHYQQRHSHGLITAWQILPLAPLTERLEVGNGLAASCTGAAVVGVCGRNVVVQPSVLARDNFRSVPYPRYNTPHLEAG